MHAALSASSAYLNGSGFLIVAVVKRCSGCRASIPLLFTVENVCGTFFSFVTTTIIIISFSSPHTTHLLRSAHSLAHPTLCLPAPRLDCSKCSRYSSSQEKKGKKNETRRAGGGGDDGATTIWMHEAFYLNCTTNGFYFYLFTYFFPSLFSVCMRGGVVTDEGEAIKTGQCGRFHHQTCRGSQQPPQKKTVPSLSLCFFISFWFCYVRERDWGGSTLLGSLSAGVEALSGAGGAPHRHHLYLLGSFQICCIHSLIFVSGRGRWLDRHPSFARRMRTLYLSLSWGDPPHKKNSKRKKVNVFISRSDGWGGGGSC
eukprot:gene7590-5351_t